MNTVFSSRPSAASAVFAAPRETVATYPTYAEAQAAVDTLSDREFPVANAAIIGLDLRTVEHVLGRLTNGKAALRGAGGGAWFGLFIGLAFAIFAPAGGWAWLGFAIGTAVFGAAWGAIFGFAAHWSTRGARDFDAVRSLEASRYDVVVPTDLAVRAMSLLGEARQLA